MIARTLLLGLIVVGNAGISNAQQQEAGGASPLELRTVLESVISTHPRLESARQGIEQAKGEQLAATAPFAPTISGSGTGVPLGYYDYYQLALAVEQRVPSTGVELKGGYRLGRGNIAPYYGERQTLNGGELFASVEVPLWANLRIDKDRAALQKAQIAQRRAGLEAGQEWLEVARDSSLAYWEWVATGLKLRANLRLLDVASARFEQVRQQVASGALPDVDATDAERVLLSRKGSTATAREKFAKAQAKLSLYYRSSTYEPVVVPLAAVPREMAIPPKFRESEVASWIKEALANRPELSIVKNDIASAKVSLQQAKNLRAPNLDLQGFVAKGVGQGSETLRPAEVGLGLSIKVPLFQRKGRGHAQVARAKLAKARATQRGFSDQITAAIRQSAQVTIISRERSILARKRLEATEILAEAERERLRQGAGDLLRINLRELDVLSAANEAVDAALELHRATVDLVYERGRTDHL